MRKLTILTLAAICALTLSACTTAKTVDGPGGSILGDVKVGESLHLDGDYKTIDVHVLEVFNDARCPTDVECASPGSVSVRLRVDATRQGVAETGSEEVAMDITPGQTPSQRFVAGVSVQLYYVEPEATTDQAVSQDDYSVRMRITDVVLG